MKIPEGPMKVPEGSIKIPEGLFIFCLSQSKKGLQIRRRIPYESCVQEFSGVRTIEFLGDSFDYPCAYLARATTWWGCGLKVIIKPITTLKSLTTSFRR